MNPTTDNAQGLRNLIASLQSMRDRMMSTLAEKFGDAFDGDFDVMLETINTLKRIAAHPPQQKRAERVTTERAVVPDGWMLAPRIPTRAMADAALYALDEEASAHATVEEAYAAMLAAAPAAPATPEPAERAMQVCCIDCGRKYGDAHGFPDLVVPNDVWTKISPTGHEGGLLCPSCMCRRAHDAGLENVPAKFTSGPFCFEATPESAEPVAWMQPDDPKRVISEPTRASSFRVGGNNERIARRYTVPLYTHPTPADSDGDMPANAKHWHDLYRAECRARQDDAARYGQQIEDLESASDGGLREAYIFGYENGAQQFIGDTSAELQEAAIQSADIHFPTPPTEQAKPSEAVDGCVCAGCRMRFIADLLVPDNVWERIRDGANLLCSTCIMGRIVGRGIWTAAHASDVDNPVAAPAQVADAEVEAMKDAWRTRIDSDVLDPDCGHEAMRAAGNAPLAMRSQTDGAQSALRSPLPVAVPNDGSDRGALLYLMQQFDAESWECPRCGHAEDTASMDSADYLRRYLAAAPPPPAAAGAVMDDAMANDTALLDYIEHELATSREFFLHNNKPRAGTGLNILGKGGLRAAIGGSCGYRKWIAGQQKGGGR